MSPYLTDKSLGLKSPLSSGGCLRTWFRGHKLTSSRQTPGRFEYECPPWCILTPNLIRRDVMSPYLTDKSLGLKSPFPPVAVSERGFEATSLLPLP